MSDSTDDLLVSWNQSSFKKMQPMAAAGVALKSPLIPLSSKGELPNSAFNPSLAKHALSAVEGRRRGDFDPTLRKLFNEFQFQDTLIQHSFRISFSEPHFRARLT